MITDTLLFDVSCVFFFAWALVIAVLCIAAFGDEVVPLSAAVRTLSDRRDTF